MPPTRQETVLVTGASSGIGLELSRLFAADGANLVLVARSEDALHRLAGELGTRHGAQVLVLPFDLAATDAPQAIVDRLTAAGVAVDVLVNNAGFGAQGAFAELPASRQFEMLQVNVVALTHLTRLLLPAMIARRSGGVLNVASTAAFQPGPYMAVYYATKAYVLSLSEALAEEASPHGVTVTCLAPGFTETGFAKAAAIERTRLVRSGGMDVHAVAVAGHRAFRRGRPLVVPGARNNVLAFSTRLAPRSVVRKIAAWLNHTR